MGAAFGFALLAVTLTACSQGGSDDCASITGLVTTHMDEAKRPGAKAAYENGIAWHLVVDHPACFDAEVVAAAKSALDLVKP